MRRKFFIGLAIVLLAPGLVLLFLNFKNKKNDVQVTQEESKEVKYVLPDSIDNAIKDFVSRKPKDSQKVEWGNIDEKWKLDNFLEAGGIIIKPELKIMLTDDNFDMFFCKNRKGSKDYGMVVNFKLFNEVGKYEKAVQEVKDWEPSLFKDTQKIIFPNTNFSGVDQNIAFKDGKYRYSEINLPGESKSSINYHILADSVIISSSQECIDLVSSELEPLE